MYPWKKPPREDRYRRGIENPSFSSSLLDRIYRSIDESNAGTAPEDDELVFYRESVKKKKCHRDFLNGEVAGDRPCIIDKAVVHRRSIAADFEMSRARRATDAVLFKNSSSSSSDSSGFSSSESDSLYGRSRSSHSPSVSRGYAAVNRPPKPIGTSVERFEGSPPIYRSGAQKPNSKHESGSFLKTKSKALKIYSDLKKVKQPLSPGGKLANFLNSLFTAGNTKKAKKNTSTCATTEQVSSSTCSSASSFSRSCLSKTPSSSGKSKRSVRFCPVSVIVDEDCKPCGHKTLYKNNKTMLREDKYNNSQYNYDGMENRRVIEAAKELLRNYHKKKKEVEKMRDSINMNDLEEDEDDAASCASSDLFELDNLSAVGIERYREELPVYETTHLGTNRAIANGLRL